MSSLHYILRKCTILDKFLPSNRLRCINCFAQIILALKYAFYWILFIMNFLDLQLNLFKGIFIIRNWIMCGCLFKILIYLITILNWNLVFIFFELVLQIFMNWVSILLNFLSISSFGSHFFACWSFAWLSVKVKVWLMSTLLLF